MAMDLWYRGPPLQGEKKNLEIEREIKREKKGFSHIG